MVSRILVLCILLSTIACSRSFHISPNQNNQVYKIIDTSSIYFLNSINGDDFVVNSRLEKEFLNQRKRGIKFYKNGMVVRFNNINLSDVKSLNPENGIIGLYNYENEILELEFRYNHVQSGYFSAKSIANVEGDTLHIKSFKTAQGSESLEKYSKFPLDKKFLIFKSNL